MNCPECDIEMESEEYLYITDKRRQPNVTYVCTNCLGEWSYKVNRGLTMEVPPVLDTFRMMEKEEICEDSENEEDYY